VRILEESQFVASYYYYFKICVPILFSLHFEKYSFGFIEAEIYLFSAYYIINI
jgi:hypothetical protein